MRFKGAETLFAAAATCGGGLATRYLSGRNLGGIGGRVGDDDDGALLTDEEEVERVSSDIGVPSRLVGVEFALLVAPILAGDGSIGGVDWDLAPSKDDP
jgi:hypothetical protein